jgi:2-amino-4-hydroxy-6-hydroxymethyldihydropteridine diphosphokinase
MSIHRVHLGLGSNLGDRRGNLQKALEQIAALPGTRVVKVSSFIETEPVDGPPQGKFINAAVMIETELEPEALLDGLQGIENELGRQREVRWGPRTVDIDILTFGQRRIETDRLTAPHPRLHERAFVLAPLVEIDPQGRHPALGKMFEELLRELKGGLP